MSGCRRVPWAALAVLAAGGAARLAVLLLLDPQTWVAGGDTPFYARQGWLLAHGLAPLFAPVAPAYTWLVAAAWACCPGHGLPGPDGPVPAAVLTLVRLAQVAASLGTAWIAWRLARRFGGSGRAAAATCAGLALGPAFVLEPFRVRTETLFLLLLVAALLLWDDARRRARTPIAAGLVFGLAALVRPVVVGIPLLLAGGMAVAGRGPAHGRRAAGFALAFVAVLAPWSVSLAVHTGSWFPRGLAANLWIGSVGDGRWQGRDATDAMREGFAGGPDDYLGETFEVVARSPGRWLATRARNLSAALVQPHFAPDLPGPSTRRGFAEWWRGDREPAGLVRLLSPPAARLKLALYLLHWLAIVGGLAGLLRRRRQWRELLPLWVVVLYFPAVHLLLTALPRYLFPIQPALWIAVALLLAPGAAPARGAGTGEGDGG